MKKYSFLLGTALIILSILLIVSVSGIVSADTLIAGKIYNSNYSNTINGASISVTCDSQTPSSATSLSDGTFAVIFNVDSCAVIGISADPIDYKIINITQTVFDNTVQPTTTPNLNGGGGGMCVTKWTCTEWNDCSEEDMQTRTCSYPLNFCTPREAKPVESQSCVYSSQKQTNVEETEMPKTQSPITGAVTGIFSKGNGWIIILIVVALLVISMITIFFMRKGNKKKEEPIQNI